MSGRRRIVWYSSLLFLAGGLLFWQWWTEPVHEGERLGTWLGRVNDADPSARVATAEALGALAGRSSDSWFHHNVDRAWKELGTMSLYDAEDDVRKKAVRELASLCRTRSQTDEPKRIERKRTAVQSLLDGFKIGNVEVRRRVPEVVYTVVGLEFHERGIRREADDAVDVQMRPAAVKALVAALKDRDGDVQDEAVLYLGKLATVPAEAEPALLELLRSKDALTRSGAAHTLGKLQRLSDDAILGLIVAAQDDSPNVRTAAFYCLVHIGPRTAPALKEAITKATDKARRGYLELCLQAVAG
jgi:HEAT repeat protein